MAGSFIRDQRGGVATMVALSMMFALPCLALAVDVGGVFLQSRQLQGVADLAALSAARDLDHAGAAAAATVTGNNLSGPVRTDITTGVYSSDANVAPANRFAPGGGPINAVRVQVHAKANVFFGAFILGRQSLDISRTATATTSQLASFSVGSRLASLNGGVANALLSGLTGSQVSLSVMDYRALASANVDLLQYSQALATSEHLQGVSYDHVLSQHVTTPQALNALADVLNHNGDIAEGTSVRAMALASTNTPSPDMSQLIDLGPYGGQDHVSGASGAAVNVSAMDLASAILTLAQQGRQVQLDLGQSIPGLTSSRVYLAIGERPNHSAWLAVSRDNSVVLHTAQMRLFIDSQLAPQAVGLLAGAQLRLPILVEAADARARLNSINCHDQTVGVDAATGIARIILGDIDTHYLEDFQHDLTVSPARILSTPLTTVTGQGDIHIGGDDWQPLSFSQRDIAVGAVRTVSTNDAVQSTVGSLLNNTHFAVSGLGLNPSLGNANGGAIGGLLQSAAAPLDSLLDSLTSLLGVGLGQADVQVHGLRCGDPALVA